MLWRPRRLHIVTFSWPMKYFGHKSMRKFYFWMSSVLFRKGRNPTAKNGVRRTSTAIEIVDIFLLPNFCKIIKPFIDTSFGRTHKEEYTQHQWRFKAVRPDKTYFPRGVKVTYKKYWSDKLVIIEKKACAAVPPHWRPDDGSWIHND